ncbi:MAG TPA: hypothetical protein VNA65_07825 [Candidatus Dormibacteraeota bacterium]|nr:hypothetical protein [Candidatus Dormibacteraeota bacterium]
MQAESRLLDDLKRIYQFHFRSERRERFFLASLSFLVTFAIVRTITHMIRSGVGPFHNVTAGATHIHHLVWGILLLLLIGFVWLSEKGVGSSWTASLTAIVYGIAAALTLDEFALWLNLRDVYWESQGRLSVDAALLFAGLLSAGWLGGPFVAAVTRHLWHRTRRPAA